MFSYLLVDEVFIIILDTKFPLRLLNFSSLNKYLSLCDKYFLPCQFTLSHHGNQLPCIFELFPESPQFLSALRVPTASLANLPNLASSEAHIRISIIRILASLELQ